jgi:hypothetical protein
MAKTIGELTEDNQELIDTTKAHMNEIASEFIKLIQEAQRQGEMDKDNTPTFLANHLQVQIFGLRTFAKINNDIELFNDMIEDLFIHYPFKMESGHA